LIALKEAHEIPIISEIVIRSPRQPHTTALVAGQVEWRNLPKAFLQKVKNLG
jgi:hypothetical protein